NQRFMITDAILLAVEHPESVFNPGTLGKLIEIETALHEIEGLSNSRIQSIHTGDNILGTEDGLDIRRFYTAAPLSQEEADAIGATVSSNTMVAGRMVSKDGKTALVSVELPESGFSNDLYNEIMRIAEQFSGPEKIHVAGRPIVEGTLAKLGPKDMSRTAPLVILVITIVLLIVLRQASRTLITLFVVLASTVWSFGLMTALGIPLYSVSIMIPVMLIANGVAYAIHVYNQVDFFVRERPSASRREIAEDAIFVIGKPSLFAALTTVAGFLSLVTSQVYPVKYFGLFTAFGVAVSWFLTMVLVPSGILLLGNGKTPIAKTTEKKEPKTLWGARFADAVSAHRVIVYAVTGVVMVTSLWGLSRVWINTSFLENFEKSSAIVQTDAFVNKNFGGTSSVNIILDSDEYDAFKQPEVLQLMDRLQSSIMRRENVGDSLSLTTYLKRMHFAMNAEDPAFDKIPESSDMVAQYLLLYEMSGDPDNLWKVVDSDFKGANMVVQLKSDDSRTIQGVIEEAESFSSDFAEMGISINFAGSGYKSLVFSDLILKGQISSLGLSVLIVFVLVSFMLRSAILGGIATIPVLITILINFGLMGVLNIPLTISTALISSIAVGIGVDYAIHFISHYRTRLRTKGDETEAARFSMSHTGRAVLQNAIIVISGFLVMVFSVFPPNRQIGLLVSLNMLSAFIATVSIMFLVLRKSSSLLKDRI
ncbi:MAG: MMPL family transporter, partial [Spirochaetia bacterium]|nr:MMPL family transporter [Spirochaetia bacterium]